MAFGPSGSGARKGAMWAIGQLSAGYDKADEQLRGGYDTASSLYNQAQQGYKALGEPANRGFGAYADYSGANDATGLARAKAQFGDSIFGQADEYGQQQVARNAGRMGLQGSGNNMAALRDYGTRDLIQRYQQYGQALAPYNSIAPAIAGQQGALYGQQANAAQQLAAQRAALTNQTYQGYAQAGGNALAAGDQTRQQMTALGMQGLSAGISGLSALAGGMGGLSGIGGALSGAMSTLGGGGGVPLYNGSGPILPGGGGGSYMGYGSPNFWNPY